MSLNPEIAQSLKTTLSEWRQGDCVLGEHWLLFRFHPEHPLTPEAEAAAVEGGDSGEAQTRGLMVATQTCDIVRNYEERPYLEVCPLVEVDSARHEEIKALRRPGYANIPSLEELRLVADLDRVMTVEKAVVLTWQRVNGCRNDAESRTLAYSLSRKRARTAFPDDFNAVVRQLQKRIKDKHDKATIEGEALRALDEIRISASPSWSAREISLFFTFIHDGARESFGNKQWAEHLRGWLQLVPAAGRFIEVGGVVTTLEDMTARDYIDSDLLDLDHLSKAEAQN